MKNRLAHILSFDGIILLAVFVLYGLFFISSDVGIYDWKKELAYFEYIRLSFVRHGTLPLLWWSKEASPYPAMNHTGIFIANPETFLFSPFIFLSYLVSASRCIKILVCLHVAIGVVGSYALALRCSMSAWQRQVFLTSVLLSPFVMQHIAIGYTPWVNIFWFPWLLFFWLGGGVGGFVGQGAVYAIMLLQGGTHVFAWCFTLFLLIALFRSTWNQRVAPLFSHVALLLPIGALAAARILPTAAVFKTFQQGLEPGYGARSFLNWALTPLPLTDVFSQLDKVIEGVPVWDGAFFWGLVLPLFFVCCCKYFLGESSQDGPRSVRERTKEMLQGRAGEEAEARLDTSGVYFAVTTVVLLVFSLNGVYAGFANAIASVWDSGLLRSVEKYPYRWAAPAYLSAIVAIVFSRISLFERDVPRRLLVVALALPLLLVSFKWMGVATSVSKEIYESPRGRLLRAINVEPPNGWKRDRSGATPGGLRIHTSNQRIFSVSFSGMEGGDSQFLEFYGAKNVDLVPGTTSLSYSVTPSHSEVVEVKLTRALYRPGIVISLISWLILVLFTLVKLAGSRKKETIQFVTVRSGSSQ
jgi:hypothetical protein